MINICIFKFANNKRCTKHFFSVDSRDEAHRTEGISVVAWTLSAYAIEVLQRLEFDTTDEF